MASTRLSRPVINPFRSSEAPKGASPRVLSTVVVRGGTDRWIEVHELSQPQRGSTAMAVGAPQASQQGADGEDRAPASGPRLT